MGMEWEQLLSHQRLGKTKKANSQDDNRSPFQRDFDRIVFSSAFRRMQDKTQVFPLPESDYVRTRLTHSLEVASVGRSLGEMVGVSVLRRNSKLGVSQADFGAIVGSACLAHDIGNPPFGHSGEQAIQTSFHIEHGVGAADYLRGLSGRERRDLEEFEGNAQGFRVLTKLQNANEVGGLQLTMATLAAFMKYPRESRLDGEEGLKGQSAKKFGVFQSEMNLAATVAEETGLIRRSSSYRAWCRHPLAFLMEAADDICYRIIDFEDGFKLDLVSFADAAERLKAIGGGGDPSKIKEAGKKEQIEYFRAIAIRTIIPEVVEVFLANEKAILDGVFDGDLVGRIKSAAQLEAIRQFSKENVYTARQVVEIEAAGFEVLGGLVKFLLPALNDYAEKGPKANPRSKKYVELLPPFIKSRLRSAMTPYERAMTITDFVSGMTDSYAVLWFKRITGMSLPS